MVTSKSIIKSIQFDVELDGKLYRGIVAKYGNNDSRLRVGSIHLEDNDSWCGVRIGDKDYNFQIYGDDDSLGVKSKLSCQLFEVVKNKKGEWTYTCVYYSSIDGSARFSNMFLNTNHGKERIKLIRPRL